MSSTKDRTSSTLMRTALRDSLLGAGHTAGLGGYTSRCLPRTSLRSESSSGHPTPTRLGGRRD